MVTVVCPNCATRLKAPDKALGKKAKCTNCGRSFVLSAPPPLPSAEPAEIVLEPVNIRGVKRLPGWAVLALCCGGGVLLLALVALVFTRRNATALPQTSVANPPLAVAAEPSQKPAASAPSLPALDATSPGTRQAAPPVDPVMRLNAVSEALRREEAKLDALLEPQYRLEWVPVQIVFEAALPKGLTHEDLIYTDPREGSIAIEFRFAVNEPTKAQKDNFEKVRKFADTFAAECKRPDSSIAKQVAAGIEALPSTQEIRRQRALVDKLRRKRDEAQAAIK